MSNIASDLTAKQIIWSPPDQKLHSQNLISPMACIPQKRALPASIALVRTKDDRQKKVTALKRYAQRAIFSSASCQSAQKRCLFPECSKMAVSKGLCRGHGGGRRCHFVGGCTKSAQSRSMFCWAHGGGQRCEVDSCTRSRKSRKYCAAHVHFENDNYLSTWNDPDTCQDSYVSVYEQNFLQSFQQMLPRLSHALYVASLSPPRFPILLQNRCDGRN
ncbi:hypothetical protein Plhal304r1_c011g0041861 [Plasmopara halstedii]